MFIFNEDRAMEKKLEGLVVPAVNSPDTGLPVTNLWFNNDIELNNLTYPAVVICNKGITKDPERESRGWVQLPYTPEGFKPWDNPTNVTESPYWAQAPIPYNIDYQIEVLARTNVHATYLRAILAGPDYLPARFGYLEIPEDGTVRRLDLNAGPTEVDTRDSDGKRLFHAAYAVRVSTELLPQQIEAYYKVQTVETTINYDVLRIPDPGYEFG